MHISSAYIPSVSERQGVEGVSEVEVVVIGHPPRLLSSSSVAALAWLRESAGALRNAIGRLKAIPGAREYGRGLTPWTTVELETL